jgi:DNA-binding NarL/FixJ family response regulator
MMKAIRLLLIEDNRLFRSGIAAMLARQRDIEIVTASGKSKDTILKIQKLKPNVILLDLGLRSQNSLRVVELVKREFPKARVIVMDLVPTEADIIRFVNAGASGFILKDANPGDFLKTIRAAAKGVTVFPPMPAKSLFTEIITHAMKKRKFKLMEAVRMTEREQEVIRLMNGSLTNVEIGNRLHVSTNTIVSHIHNIMEKIALHERLDGAGSASTKKTVKMIARSISTISN